MSLLFCRCRCADARALALALAHALLHLNINSLLKPNNLDGLRSLCVRACFVCFAYMPICHTHVITCHRTSVIYQLGTAALLDLTCLKIMICRFETAILLDLTRPMICQCETARLFDLMRLCPIICKGGNAIIPVLMRLNLLNSQLDMT